MPPGLAVRAHDVNIRNTQGKNRLAARDQAIQEEWRNSLPAYQVFRRRMAPASGVGGLVALADQS
jgi:hypothetical protein